MNAKSTKIMHHTIGVSNYAVLLQTLWTFCHVSDDTIYDITTLSQTTNT